MYSKPVYQFGLFISGLVNIKLKHMKNALLIAICLVMLAACRKNIYTCPTYDRSTISITQTKDSVFISHDQLIYPTAAHTRVELVYKNGNRTAGLAGPALITWNSQNNVISSERLKLSDIELVSGTGTDTVTPITIATIYYFYHTNCYSGFDSIKFTF